MIDYDVMNVRVCVRCGVVMWVCGGCVVNGGMMGMRVVLT